MLVEHVVMEGDTHTITHTIEHSAEALEVEERREQAFLRTFNEWLEVYPGD